jgi:hypothetical protein
MLLDDARSHHLRATATPAREPGPIMGITDTSAWGSSASFHPYDLTNVPTKAPTAPQPSVPMSAPMAAHEPSAPSQSPPVVAPATPPTTRPNSAPRNAYAPARLRRPALHSSFVTASKGIVLLPISGATKINSRSFLSANVPTSGDTLRVGAVTLQRIPGASWLWSSPAAAGPTTSRVLNRTLAHPTVGLISNALPGQRRPTPRMSCETRLSDDRRSHASPHKTLRVSTAPFACSTASPQTRSKDCDYLLDDAAMRLRVEGCHTAHDD